MERHQKTTIDVVHIVTNSVGQCILILIRAKIPCTIVKAEQTKEILILLPS